MKYLIIACVVCLSAVVICATMLFHRAPMVSVVMSTYNRGDWLKDAVDSVLNQTFRDFEFIIIDDGSSDETADYLADLEKKDPRVVVLRNLENKGLVFSLNRGISHARGKYIARMDDDDVCYPERFARQVSFMEKHPEITVLGSRISPLGSEKPWPFHKETNPNRCEINLYLGDTPVSHPSVMIRKSFLVENQIKYDPDYLHAEDRPFYGAILSAGGKIAALPDILLQYRLTASKKPHNYYIIQVKNRNRFHEGFYEPFSTSKKTFYEKTRCDRLSEMILKNPDLKKVDQVALEQMAYEECLTGGDLQKIRVRHPFLPRSLFLKKTSAGIKLYSINREEGDVVSWNDKEVTFKGKDGVQEILRREENSSFFESERFLYLEHPSWKDWIEIQKGDFKRVSGDGGKILTLNEDKIVLQWKKWGTETFKRDKNEKEKVFRFAPVKKLSHEKNGKKTVDIKSQDVADREILLYFKHSSWSDWIKVEGKRFCRSVGECGDILMFDDDKMTVKWDNWGKETFVREKDEIFRIK